MHVRLLEREEQLNTLDGLLAAIPSGGGRAALISGEAGIGKTSLVECFLAHHNGAVRVLWGACEALFTPSPLGPLYDIAQQARAPLRELLDGQVNRARLFAAVLDELTDGSTATITVIEDIHWADAATLDLIKYLARRIHRTRTLLILTYRDEELSRDHPLRQVLGDLPARDVLRLHLSPLSADAVALLAKWAHRSDERLHTVTSGNPFFLSEVLASHTLGVPTSVSDAVLAQVARRSPEARNLLEFIAVAPNKVAWSVVEAINVAFSAALEECIGAGLLHVEGSAVGYRHELARQAVEYALAPLRRRSLHAEMLRGLQNCGDEQATLALLVHHAVQAEDGALVLQFAPAAARQASARWAHREAAAQYRTALRFADALAAPARAELLEGLSLESCLADVMTEAVQAREDALAIRRAEGESLKVGHDLRWLSRMYWYLGRKEDVDRAIRSAVEVLESLPVGRELAMAFSYRAMFSMLAEDTSDARLWGNRALALAEQFDDHEVRAHALNTLGMCYLFDGDAQGESVMQQSLSLALEHDLEEHAARAYSNLSMYWLRAREYVKARRFADEGISYCADRDLDLYGVQMISWRALLAVEQGEWLAGSEDANTVLSAHLITPVNKIEALVARSVVRLRRGDPGGAALLDEARDLALPTGELQRLVPVMAARAEAAWLRGDCEACTAAAQVGLEIAHQRRNQWALGQLTYWLWRCGGLIDVPKELPEPYAREATGDWQGAAAAWERIGCPYEQAMALMEGGEFHQREALSIFERLGAVPAAEIVRRRLRAAGARGLARGPRPTTKANPHGLTPRQLEILLLLAKGLQNTEIAERLSTSSKTVEHHVSAVLAKLDAHSRIEAVRIATRLELVPVTTGMPAAT